MRQTLRSATLALLVTAAAGLATSAAQAAPAGQFSPLKSVVAADGSVEQINYRWGRRCYRACHVGRHGRLWCTWRCYRPRRWW